MDLGVFCMSNAQEEHERSYVFVCTSAPWLDEHVIIGKVGENRNVMESV